MRRWMRLCGALGGSGRGFRPSPSLAWARQDALWSASRRSAVARAQERPGWLLGAPSGSMTGFRAILDLPFSRQIRKSGAFAGKKMKTGIWCNPRGQRPRFPQAGGWSEGRAPPLTAIVAKATTQEGEAFLSLCARKRDRGIGVEGRRAVALPSPQFDGVYAIAAWGQHRRLHGNDVEMPSVHRIQPD